jgi:hypothetical protein
MLKSALLFYRKFVDDLKNYTSPFVINPYDPCVANATIGGKQMTITWHIEDLKISHVDAFRITIKCQYIASIYGDGLVIYRGKVHDYLGMDMHFGIGGTAQISMMTYTNKVISNFPKTIDTTCTLPAGEHLFSCAMPLKPNSSLKYNLKLSITRSRN